MQIGIDVGATKIESVVLEENGQEKHRSRTSCPKDYLSIINAIKSVGLNENSIYKYPHQFSGGQRQRIAIARVLV